MQVPRSCIETPNVHPAERLLSIVSGAALTYSGITRGKSGIFRIITGAVMLHRGITGKCETYRLLGLRTAAADASVPYELGVKARASVTIAHDRHKIYEFWCDLENLPRFMDHLISVTAADEKKSHWVARGPAGKQVAWDAEIINEVPGELIAWKSLPGADVDSAGSVRFSDAPGGRGTEIRVTLQYNPPAGIVGAYVARFFGREPEQEITADLFRLKQFLESGEMATAKGQPHGPAERSLNLWNVVEEAIA